MCLLLRQRKEKGSSGRQQLDAAITLPSAARLATTVPGSSFEIPAGYTETQMMMPARQGGQ